MNMSLLSPFRTLPVVLLLVVVAAGCRTYGSYNAEALILEEIVQANRMFAEDLERARGDLAVLEGLEAANVSLEPLVAAYAAVILQQETLLALHQAMAEEAAENDDDYRLLHRTYGAIITDQQLIRDRYSHVLEALQNTLAPEAFQATIPLLSSYQIKPAFYQRIEHGLNQPSLRELAERSASQAASTDTTNTTAPN